MEEGFILDKKTKRILFVAIVVITMPLVALVCWKISHSIGGYDLILKKATDMTFHGRVDSIYFDKQNHNTETLVLSDKTRFKLYPNWATYVAVGDSLAKDTGTVQVFVYKKGVKTHILDYKKLMKYFKSNNW